MNEKFAMAFSIHTKANLIAITEQTMYSKDDCVAAAEYEYGK